MFVEFHEALLRNVTANDAEVRHCSLVCELSVSCVSGLVRFVSVVGQVSAYPSVVGMYPGFTAEEAESCCAWGGVDIIYPFPLVNITSPTAVSSSAYSSIDYLAHEKSVVWSDLF